MNEQGKTDLVAVSAQAKITPETKIATLLKEFPELEETLLELSPTFAKLRNPILRKTVAKVTNLRQAAQIGNISLGTMINTLRRAAGMQEAKDIVENVTSDSVAPPDWVKQDKPWKTFDARPMIENGGHPVNLALEVLEALKNGETYELITPFLPAPLIDIARSRGFLVWSSQEGEDLVKTFFRRI